MKYVAKIVYKDFTGDPVVQTPHFHCRDHGLQQRSHMPHGMAKYICKITLFNEETIYNKNKNLPNC